MWVSDLCRIYVHCFTGRYDISQLVLVWEVESPVIMSGGSLSDNSWVPYLAEYRLLKIIPQSEELYIEPISLDPTSSQYSIFYTLGIRITQFLISYRMVHHDMPIKISALFIFFLFNFFFFLIQLNLIYIKRS